MLKLLQINYICLIGFSLVAIEPALVDVHRIFRMLHASQILEPIFRKLVHKWNKSIGNTTSRVGSSLLVGSQTTFRGCSWLFLCGTVWALYQNIQKVKPEKFTGGGVFSGGLRNSCACCGLDFGADRSVVGCLKKWEEKIKWNYFGHLSGLRMFITLKTFGAKNQNCSVNGSFSRSVTPAKLPAMVRLRR